MTRPKQNDAIISPKIIVGTVTGEDINRSSVRACVSHGATVGDIAVAVKNNIILSRPGIIKSIDRFLPTAKARNRKIGNSIPNMTTGPLE